MMFKLPGRKAEKKRPVQEQAIVLSIDSGSRGLEFLVELVRRIRPTDPKDLSQVELKFRALLYSLHQDRSLLFSLRRALLSQFHQTRIVQALTESGITSSRGFGQELSAKIKHKLIPSLQHKDNFLFVLNRIFYKKSDYKWVQGIDAELWKSFFGLIGIQINLAETRLSDQLRASLRILSFRLANIGLEKEITTQEQLQSSVAYPFIEQNRWVGNLLDSYQNGNGVSDKSTIIPIILECLHNCRQQIRLLRDRRTEQGTSLSQTFLLVRMEQIIERMFIILDVLDEDQHLDTERFIQYFHQVVRFENRKNSIIEFLYSNLGMVAYQIAEHKGRRGQNYIAASRWDFIKLFRSAARGGFIISFIALFKNIMARWDMIPFWQGIFYGSNYAMGFVIMDQTGATLATKQPAYTASALVGTLDTRKHQGKPDLSALVHTIAQVSRSQIASFAGNLLLVFPMTWFLAWCWHQSTGAPLAVGAAAIKLLEDQHPWHSLSLLYACFTGFFLFLSGIIAGYVENHVVYGKIPERLQTHPILSNTLSKRRLTWLVNFVRRHSGAFVGSVALGFFLGMAGPLGKIFGIPFDIRHITISAGNTAIGLYGLHGEVSTAYLVVVLLGVLTIGFLNFLVSFALAFYVAVRSRGIRLRDYPELLGMVLGHFRRHPLEFLFPVRNRKKG